MFGDVIIVADSKIEMEVGQTLKNLISKLGEYSAALWETKHFKDNEPQISSRQKIIFIGINDFSSRSLSSVEWKYEKLNMRYGWIGSVAILQVMDQNLSKNELEVFKNMCSEQKAEIEKIAKSKVAGNVAVAAGLALAGGLIGLGIFAVFKLITNSIKSKNELLKKEYIYMATEFFVKDINSFMGNTGNEQ
jgi:hypothetical protein